MYTLEERENAATIERKRVKRKIISTNMRRDTEMMNAWGCEHVGIDLSI